MPFRFNPNLNPNLMPDLGWGDPGGEGYLIEFYGENGAPGTIRTSDPQIRSLMLYPAELRVRIAVSDALAGCEAIH